MKVGQAEDRRSAGNFAQLVGKTPGYAQIKLDSGELRVCGRMHRLDRPLSNPDNMNRKSAKPAACAGWLSAA